MYGEYGPAHAAHSFIAANGIILRHMHAASAVCTPSRAALMTGRYPQRVGLHYSNDMHPVELFEGETITASDIDQATLTVPIPITLATRLTWAREPCAFRQR